MVAFANPVSTGRPEIASRVVGWTSHVPPDKRTMETVDIGVTFRYAVDVMRFQMRLVSNGGAVAGVSTVSNPNVWFDSLDEYDSIGNLSWKEIDHFHHRGSAT